MKPLLDYSPHQLYQLSDNMAHQLTQAALGQTNDLAFLRHVLPQHDLVDIGQKFQVISIGGSNIMTAMATFSPQLKLFKPQVLPLPQMDSASKVLTLLNQVLNPETKFVCLNFAYPLQPETYEDLLDGRLLHGTKEHHLSGLEHILMGKWLVDQLAPRPIQITVANDVICLALSALQEYPNLPCSQLSSMVLGTGNNIGLFIDNHVVVNLESGNFGEFEISDSCKEIDQASQNKGTQLFEKEVAGAYLHQHFNYYSRQRQLGIELQDTKELSDLLQGPPTPASKLAQEVVERSSAMVAALLKGMWLYKKKQRLVCAVEGSLYWKMPGYAQNLNRWLNHLSVPETAIKFVYVENSNLIGAAYLSRRFGT